MQKRGVRGGAAQRTVKKSARNSKRVSKRQSECETQVVEQEQIDPRIAALGNSYHLFMKERALSFFVREFRKMQFFKLWRKLLGRALIHRVAAMKTKQMSPPKQTLPTKKKQRSPNVLITSVKSPPRKFDLNMSDEFLIAAINPKRESLSPLKQSEIVSFSLSHPEEPKDAPQSKSPIKPRLSPKEIVDDEFSSSDKPQADSVRKLPDLSSDSSDRQDVLESAVKRVSGTQSPKNRQNTLKKSIFQISESDPDAISEDETTSSDTLFNRRSRENNLSSTIEFESPSRRSQGSQTADDLNIFQYSESDLEIDDDFPIGEGDQVNGENVAEESASMDEAGLSGSSAQIEFLLREPKSLVNGSDGPDF